jgi:hypothetical protein
LTETFPDLPDMTVLDLGGRVDTWERAPVRAAHVHVVNLEPTPADLPPWAEADHGDAPEAAARKAERVFRRSTRRLLAQILPQLGGEALTAARPPCGDDLAAAVGRHARTESVTALAHELARLIGPFHG